MDDLQSSDRAKTYCVHSAFFWCIDFQLYIVTANWKTFLYTLWIGPLCSIDIFGYFIQSMKPFRINKKKNRFVSTKNFTTIEGEVGTWEEAPQQMLPWLLEYWKSFAVWLQGKRSILRERKAFIWSLKNSLESIFMASIIEDYSPSLAKSSISGVYSHPGTCTFSWTL